MDTRPRFRRLARYGWAVEDSEGRIRAVRVDGGSMAPVVDELLGTAEASRLLGLRPPNFVRDWASRGDFPAPVAELSSGRVWLAGEVKRYAARHRSPKPTRERLLEIARRLVWWQEPDTTLERPLDLLARVMASGSLEEIGDVERSFGRAALREALIDASPGVFDPRSWNYWLVVFDLDQATPLPARHAP